MDDDVPTVYAWAGGRAAFDRLTGEFYRRVRDDDVLSPLFADMPADHPQHVATWLSEVFGGPLPCLVGGGGRRRPTSGSRGRRPGPAVAFARE
jgi:hemoglobin